MFYIIYIRLVFHQWRFEPRTDLYILFLDVPVFLRIFLVSASPSLIISMGMNI